MGIKIEPHVNTFEMRFKYNDKGEILSDDGRMAVGTYSDKNGEVRIFITSHYNPNQTVIQDKLENMPQD